jgi:hypothetical protein
MTRVTPFDLVFAPIADRLTALTAAAAAVGRNPGERREFALVPETQRLLADLEMPDVVERHPEAAEEYLTLLHAAYAFDAAGRRMVTTTRAQLEPWLARPAPAAAPRIPGAACYVQLPTPWFWARRDDTGPHEPLDGMFAVASARADEVTVLAILGLRPERGGFTQVTVRARPADFAAARAVRREPPFAPLMEGGQTAGFRSVASGGELLTLLHLALLSTGG